MSDIILHTPECAASHFGNWLIEPRWFCDAVESARNGTLKAQAPGESTGLYAVVSGTAVIPIAGQMMKGQSKYGGTSTVMTRRAIRMAANDDSVDSILLRIDSPGGTVAGTADLANDVAAANTKKPCYAYVEDMCASAALWVAAQTRRVYANQTALVGSIGVVTALVDTSGRAAMEGVKVHVISTGEFKGAGIDGAPITDKQIADVQSMVDQINEHFIAAIANGRGMTDAKVRELADGRVHLAEAAMKLGLIDEIASLDAAMQAITTEVTKMNAEQFASYAAENPEAAEVKALLAKGHKAGFAEGRQQARAEFDQMVSAFPTDPAFAIKAYAKGRTVDEARELKSEIDAARAEESAKTAAMQAELDKAKAAASAQAPLNLAASAPEEPSPVEQGKVEQIGPAAFRFRPEYNRSKK